MSYYLVYGQTFGCNIAFEAFKTADEARDRARQVDKKMGTEWVVIKGEMLGLGIDDAIDWFEDYSDQ